MFKNIFLFGLIFISVPVFSAGSIESKVEYVQVNVDAGLSNVAVIKFTSTTQNAHQCATDNRMIVDLETSGGKSALSMALAAKAAGARLRVEANGACINGLEVIAYMRYL
ncbi:MAG: hypothetical protein K6L81_14315 [Agarilytica sp.]